MPEGKIRVPMNDDKGPWQPAFQASAAMASGFLTQYGGSVVQLPDPMKPIATAIVEAANGMRFAITVEQVVQ